MMTFTCPKCFLNKQTKKANSYYLHNDVFYKICKHQQFCNIIEVRMLFAITFISKIFISAIRTQPREIAKMSHNTIGIFDLLPYKNIGVNLE